MIKIIYFQMYHMELAFPIDIGTCSCVETIIMLVSSD